MTDSARLGAILLAALLAVSTAVLLKFSSVLAEDEDQKRIALGRSLYDAHCAKCHGKKLEGQPDWQTRLPSGRLPAPPHDESGHSWHHPDKVLIGVTRNGLKPYAGEDYESDMPAFAGALSDQEIEAVVAFIKSTWPERERAFQARRSAPRN